MKTILYLILLLMPGLAAAADSSRPNIVLIISDDHGFPDYGFMGHPIVRTPNLDRMAAEGLLYTRGYTMPVCSPSLACLLTGQPPHRHGITGNDLAKTAPKAPGAGKGRQPLADRLLANSLIVPRALTQLGYLTFQSGKLWNMTYKEAGFTHGMTNTAGRHGDAGLTIGRQGMQPIYDFIGQATKERKPFFVWYAPFMPHEPHTPPPEILAKYTGKGPTPAAEKYHAMVEWFDQTCGELDAYLTKNGLAEDTVILYLADNGWDANRGGAARRSKLSPYELGIRTPIFVRRPTKLTPLRDDETPASILDFAPTILKLAGARPPEELPGRDLLDRQAMKARKAVFVEAYRHDIADLKRPSDTLIARVVISGWFKLLIPGPAKANQAFAIAPTQPELFDLKSDPLETRNLAAEQPDEIARLRALQDAFWKAD